ncbi:MAG: hypothetical protein ABI811_07130 [Acidobacteriota bacterium]
MRSAARTSLLLATAAGLVSAASFSFQVIAADRGAWPEALSSIGLVEVKSPDPKQSADIVVLPPGAAEADWRARVDRGTILILEGESPASAVFGFHPAARPETVTVRSVIDTRAPQLGIVWEEAVPMPRFEIPAQAKIYAHEKWQGAPLLAGFRQGRGAVLWIATSLGSRGYSRYPYLLQALTDLGLQPPVHSARLWTFFDSAYRARVDLDYFAPHWRAAGISALHVAAWHYWEHDAENDEYLNRLIEACHRNAIQVYAWVELPHVSERFWLDHPEWREKTALQQDAQLDWRKLMNLTNRDAFAAVSQGLRELATRFDWDGINLAELYFESLEGHDNPARFTPMNGDVRAEFRAASGFDPLELFSIDSPHSVSKSAASLAQFLDYRAELARRQQTEWIQQIENIRKTKPWLDLVLTHVDDRLDPSMREKIGADTAKTLPLLTSHDFTFLIEDPATTWNQGPQRYPQIAARYKDAAPRPEKLAMDINVVERYQDVYPTKQQTGLELFQLVHAAAASFPRVALYFESSLTSEDLPLLSSSAASVDRLQRAGNKLIVESRNGAGVAWTGSALVDGRPWPVRSEAVLWLSAGTHSVEASTVELPLRLTGINADLSSATALPNGLEFVYSSSARAFAILDKPAASVEIDGEAAPSQAGATLLMLPRGQHLVTVTIAPDKRSAR